MPATAATRRRARREGHAREERHAERCAAAEGGARGAARRPRAPHARRRSDRGPRRARRARQQQQGGSLHQPARQRVGPARRCRRGGLLPEPRGIRRRGPARGAGRQRGAAGLRRRRRATSRSCSGRWRRRATSSSPPRSRSAIEASLRERVPMSPRAIEQAPFRVLVGANMPAVLVEMGFLTNPQQEQRSSRATTFQNAIVQALVDGIVRFRDEAPRPTGAAAAAPHAPPDARVADAAPPRDPHRDCRAGDRRRVGAVRRPAALVRAEADRARRRGAAAGERRAQDHRDAVLRRRRRHRG